MTTGEPDRAAHDPTDASAVPIEVTVQARNWMSRYGWLYGVVWLFYLIEPAREAAQHPDPVTRVLGVVALAAFAAWHIAIFASIRTTRWRRWEVSPWRGWRAIGVLAVLAALSAPAAGAEALATLVYIVAAAVMVLPTRDGFVLAGGLIAGVLLLDEFVPSWGTGAGLLFGMVVSALAVWGVRQMIARNADLVAAQQQIARLAIAEERARTARDLHDILGHSLTVITVKAELAGRLVRVDTDRAEREIADLERLSREALADVRRTVNGDRAVTLAGELASARAALDAAGIEAELPVAIDDVPGKRRELFGWVVREGVTNVVRHAHAGHCVVRVGPDSVEVADDGDGAVGSASGNGLRGLRERVTLGGGTLTVGRSDLGGFLLRVRMSEATR